MKPILFFFGFVFSIASYSQEHAWVFFTDKEDVVKSLSKPESILSIRAIDRKHQYGIKIDERDVPVTAVSYTHLTLPTKA